jgi:predicted transcriptional regulator
VTKTSAVIPDDVAAALKERAKAEDRSVGAVVRRAIADHVARPVDQQRSASTRPSKDGERR